MAVAGPAAVSALVFVLVNLFGSGDVGPIVFSIALVVAVSVVFLRARPESRATREAARLGAGRP